ncbi:hypothetical protein C7475_1021280 [Chitinophaga sp. S165]|nr:hypothetical protein C7475_1021280 [Chitinophaga sp. S165]
MNQEKRNYLIVDTGNLDNHKKTSQGNPNLI